jgi:hypothetical protein
MKNYEKDRIEKKYCYGSHSWQARFLGNALCGSNGSYLEKIFKEHKEEYLQKAKPIVRYRVLKRLNRLNKKYMKRSA